MFLSTCVSSSGPCLGEGQAFRLTKPLMWSKAALSQIAHKKLLVATNRFNLLMTNHFKIYYQHAFLERLQSTGNSFGPGAARNGSLMTVVTVVGT